MNRFISAVPVVLVLSAGSFTAMAADEAPTRATPAAATQPAPARTATAAPTAPPKAASTTPNAAAGNDASAQRTVCLDMTHKCFAMKPKTDDAAAKAKTASIDLKAPDIRRVVPEVELRQPDEPVQDVQQVQVESTRPDEVYAPLGLASLPWAVMHPTQAWRIFMPVPPGVAK